MVQHARRVVRLLENDFDTDALVFTLEPSGREAVGVQPTAEFPPAPRTIVEDVPVESHMTDHMIVTARSQIDAFRRESPLVKRFEAFADSLGKTSTGKRITIQGEIRAFRADIFIREWRLLIEAKGSADRNSFRMAVGQVADYRRHLDEPDCAILLPEKPSEDLLDLAKREDIGVIWALGDRFESTMDLW